MVVLHHYIYLEYSVPSLQLELLPNPYSYTRNAAMWSASLCNEFQLLRIYRYALKDGGLYTNLSWYL